MRSSAWPSRANSLFPPLGLATLAAYLNPDDVVTLQDEHVEPLDLDDSPQLVVIQVYITSAYRAYTLADHYRARGADVCLGGLHITALPEEAARHADSIFHILTPYPGTALHTRMAAEGRITSQRCGGERSVRV